MTFKLYRPKGCNLCDKTGYKGRMGIHELVVATDGIKRMVQKHETVEVMRNKAMSEGMTTLLQDGILKSLEGLRISSKFVESASNNFPNPLNISFEKLQASSSRKRGGITTTEGWQDPAPAIISFSF